MTEQISWTAFLVFFMGWMFTHMGKVQAQGAGVVMALIGLGVVTLGVGLDARLAAQSLKPEGGVMLPVMMAYGILAFEVLIGLWQPLERRSVRKKAKARLAGATAHQIGAVVSKVIKGAQVTQFSLINGRLTFNQGSSSSVLVSSGMACSQWTSLPKNDLDRYAQEALALEGFIPDALMVLEQSAIREICINMFFSWEIGNIRRSKGQMSIDFHRRGTTKAATYPCTAYMAEWNWDIEDMVA